MNLPTEILLAIRHIALASSTLTVFNSVVWSGGLVALGLAYFDRLSRSLQLVPLHTRVSSERLPLEVLLQYQRGVNS